jgi:hypothetical protein
MKRFWILTAVLQLTVAVAARAQSGQSFLSATDIGVLNACGNYSSTTASTPLENLPGNLLCLGYVKGVADVATLRSDCGEEVAEATPDEVAREVRKFIRERGVRNGVRLTPLIVTVMVLSEKYHCAETAQQR